MNHHMLKTHPAIFHAVARGDKTFDIRPDDRAFQCGDIVELRFFDPERDKPGFPMPPPVPGSIPDPISFRVGFVLRGGQYGIEPGYVAFSLLPLEPELPDCANPSGTKSYRHDGKGVPVTVKGKSQVIVTRRNETAAVLKSPHIDSDSGWIWTKTNAAPYDIIAYMVI